MPYNMAIVSPNEKKKKKKKSPDISQIGWDKATTKTNSKPFNFLTFGEKNQQQVRQIKEYTRGTKKNVPPREQILAHTCCLPPPPIE